MQRAVESEFTNKIKKKASFQNRLSLDCCESENQFSKQNSKDYPNMV